MIIPLKFISAVLLGKAITRVSRLLNIGHGSTWPGHLAIKICPDIFSTFSRQVAKKIIIIAGTNGKTTTAKMIRTVLEKQNLSVIHNESGANLVNGIVSSYIIASGLKGDIKADYAIFEVDEATLPLILARFEQDNKLSAKLLVVLLNLFRDQLDRYGEVDTIARKWIAAVQKISESSVFILNADDPQIAEIGMVLKRNPVYFGLTEDKYFSAINQHATDSIYCLNCGAKLDYRGVYYSHLGDWSCPKCKRKKPEPVKILTPKLLEGVYNIYNTMAAYLTCINLGLSKKQIDGNLKSFQPAFGRQEVVRQGNKNIKILLSKNPVGLNVSIKAITENLTRKIPVVLALNDQIPDGRDVSWIWDADLEPLINHASMIVCTGERAFDMAVRVKYSLPRNIINSSSKFLLVEPEMTKALSIAVSATEKNQTLYILPTYSAMLALRKILSGREIL